MTPTTQARSTGPTTSLRALGRTALDVLRTRVELLVVELAQERDRIAQLALSGALAVMSLCLALQSVAVVAVAWYWDTPYRFAVAAGAAGFFVAGCVACVLMFAGNLRTKVRAFDSTLQALAADVEALT